MDNTRVSEARAELCHQAETGLQGSREYLYLLGNKQAVIEHKTQVMMTLVGVAALSGVSRGWEEQNKVTTVTRDREWSWRSPKKELREGLAQSAGWGGR